jgi:hypothetical protein
LNECKALSESLDTVNKKYKPEMDTLVAQYEQTEQEKRIIEERVRDQEKVY